MSWCLARFWDVKDWVIHHSEAQNEPLSLQLWENFSPKAGQLQQKRWREIPQPQAACVCFKPSLDTLSQLFGFRVLKVSYLDQSKLQGLCVAKDVMPGHSLNQFCVFFISCPHHSSCIHEEVPLWRSCGTDAFTPRKGASDFWSKTLHLPNPWSLMCARI